MKIKPRTIIKDDEVGISAMSITYTQNPDTNSPIDDYQYLTISAVPCDECASNVDGDSLEAFYDIKIDGHWSIGDPQELAYPVKDFQKRYSIVTRIDNE